MPARQPSLATRAVHAAGELRFLLQIGGRNAGRCVGQDGDRNSAFIDRDARLRQRDEDLGQIIDGSQLHRRHGGGDVAVAREHDGACVGADLGELGDDIEAVAVLQPHVDDGEGRRLLPDQVHTFGHRVCHAHLEAARLHGPRQPQHERPVVVDQDQGAIFRKLVRTECKVFCHFGASNLPHYSGLIGYAQA